jgi:hypothetical protein
MDLNVVEVPADAYRIVDRQDVGSFLVEDRRQAPGATQPHCGA